MASCNNKKCSFTESYDAARDGVTATPAVGLVRRRCNYSARSPWTEEDNEICKQKAAAILAAAASLTLLGGLVWQAYVWGHPPPPSPFPKKTASVGDGM